MLPFELGGSYLLKMDSSLMNKGLKNDQELLKAYVKNGDASAFTAIVERHAPMVYRVCLRITTNHHDAEDATQAVFSVLIKKANSVRKQLSLGSWLHGVARTTSLYYLRSEVRRKKREQIADMPDNTEDPISNDVDRDQILSQIDKALGRLSDHQREAIVLRFLEGHSVETAASHAGCTPDVLKSRTRHAMSRLRKSLFKKEVVAGTTILSTVLGSEANSQIPQDVLSSVVVNAPAIASGAAAITGSATILTNGVMNMYTIMKAKMIGLYAVASLSVGIGITAVMATDYHEDVQVIGKGVFQGSSSIQTLCISPDSQFLALGYEPENREVGGISIWNLKDMRKVKDIPVADTICDIKYDSSGTRLYFLTMGSFNQGKLIGWDLEKNKSLFEHNVRNYYGTIALNEKKQAVITVTEPEDTSKEKKEAAMKLLVKAISIEQQRAALKLFNTAKERGKALNELRGTTINEEQFKAARKLGREVREERDQRENITAWDMITGKKIKSWNGLARRQKNRGFGLVSFACSNDGTKLICTDMNNGRSGKVSSLNDAQVSVLDWDNGKILNRWKADKRTGVNEWLPGDEKILAQDSEGFLVLDPTSGKVLHRFPGECALSYDKKKIISLFNDVLVSYSAKTFQRKDTESIPAKGMKMGFKSVMSPDNRWLVALASSNHTPFIFDLVAKELKSPKPAAFLSTPTIHYAADGRLFVFDDNALRVFNEAGEEISKSKMAIWGYHPGYGDHSPDGRFFLSSDKRGAQLWDTVMGQRVKKHADHSGSVGYVSLAPTLTHAVTVGGYDGTLKIHDLNTGLVLSEIKGPIDQSNSARLEPDGIFWDMARQRLALGDSNARWYKDKEDLKKQGSYGTVDVAGIIDMHTGKRLHRFADEDGVFARTVSLKASGHEMLYGNASFVMRDKDQFGRTQYSPDKYFLWRLSDGGFLRNMPDVGNAPKISKDGKLLYGTKGVVDIKTGKFTHKHGHFDQDLTSNISVTLNGKDVTPADIALDVVINGKKAVINRAKIGDPEKYSKWYYQPGSTLALHVDDQRRINVYNAQSSHLLWQQPLVQKPLKASIKSLVLHPAESHIALTVKGEASLLQLELFRPVVYPKTLNMQQAIVMLAHKDIQERMRGVSFLLDQDQEAVVALRRYCKEKVDSNSPKSAMAVFSLGQLARQGVKGARAALEELEWPSAHSAIKRLDAHKYVNALRKRN